MVKLIYSEKITKFCEISTLLLTGTTEDKSKMEILRNFVAFSEYMNFNKSATTKCCFFPPKGLLFKRLEIYMGNK